jgi:DnaJ-class molecular chaperone
VKVTVPKRLKKRERELLEELQNQPHDDPREPLFT